MNNRKLYITILLLIVLIIIGSLFYKSLFPTGPILNPLPNSVSDHSQINRQSEEEKLVPNPVRNLYFGDLHVHTALSLDAFIGGCLANPEDAYQFAKGIPIQVFNKEMKIDRPLDFSAVTEHAEALGEMYTTRHEEEEGYRAFLPRLYRSVYDSEEEFGLDTARLGKLFRMAYKRASSQDPQHPPFFRGYSTTTKAWKIIIDAAEKHYIPGKFTTFAGFEWSHTHGQAQMHRNIIFKDMLIPDYPMSSFELHHEKELWDWMKELTQDGATVMAIPHNTNLAEGGAFSDRDEFGNSITAEYAQLRQDFEPLIEIHQAKGNSEVHAAFWKNDEFADYQNYTHALPLENNYVRWALKKGLEHEHNIGVNPFKFGLIGSTDNHSATPGNVAENAENLGNNAFTDFYPELRSTMNWFLDPELKVYEAVNPGGLAAVWAEENTRGYIYDALKRKECYATSGSRIQLRFFAGYGFKSRYRTDEELVQDGFAKGVPMGSDLLNPAGKTPEFLIWAKKDSVGANLDRIQIIKGWHKHGQLHEKIFNVALSDGRKENHDGSIPDNGATVNFETGEWAKDKGDEEIMIVWKDPEFDPQAKAFYYVRVIEIPTASWQLWDKIRFGTHFPDHVPMTVRERAWSSPIWYSPKNS